MNPLALSRSLPGSACLAPIQTIEDYIRFAYSIPMLEEGEEQALAERLKTVGDLKAAERLVLSHLRFVIKIARGFSGYGLQMADLIQEGNIGLMKAVRRFDPALGVRLASFAVHWIKSEIHEFVIRNWRIVRVATTKAQRKLFFNLRGFKKRLGWFGQDEIQAVADELKVSPADVIEMEQRLNGMDISFDAPESEEEDRHFAPAQYLTSSSISPEESRLLDEEETLHTEKLPAILKSLDARSQDILKQRFLNEKKATLEELAALYSVSAERIRQLEAQALLVLKKQLLSA